METMLKKMMDMVFGESFVNDCIKAINGSIFTDSGAIHPKIEGMIKATEESVQSVAAVMLVMYLLIELMDKMTSDSFNGEQFVKMLMKFVFGQILISNATQWSLTFMHVGSAFMVDIAASTSASATSISLAGIEEAVNAMGFFEKLIAVVILLLPVLVSFLLRIAVFFMAYSRALEIVVRAIMSPIGCADIISGGSHSSGFRYLKRMLGICLQGGLMVVVILASSTLLSSSSIFDKGFQITDIIFLGQYFGLMGSMVGMLGATKTIAYEVVGA